MNTNYANYKERMQKIGDVIFSAALGHWDKETKMPPKGNAFRARQSATLMGIAHELFIDEKFADLLKNLSEDKSLSKDEATNVKETLKEFRMRKKYPTEFVETLSNAISNAYQSWQTAKKENNFNLYIPALKKMIELKKQEAEILGYAHHPYDALLDQYEPGAKTAEVETLFNDVKLQLVNFVREISNAPQNRNDFMFYNYDLNKQWDFSLDLLKQMGFDFQRGRQDKSTHPFTVHFSPDDVRVTTRMQENNISDIIWCTIHEGGHALYEQGLKPENYGLPAGEYISLGIHESQSRLWENNVGRSLPYWKSNFPKLKNYFPELLKEVNAEDFYKAMNFVKPSLIRTNADELTYHCHILIRFEIEKALIEGSIKVKDLREVWNAKYFDYFGLKVPSDAEGVVQDIHWAHGSIGYFPTYSLGSFYAAQFFATAKKTIPDLENQIESGNLIPLHQWLKENIYQYGKLYTADEICIKLTGEKLNFKYFMNYAKEKYSKIYKMEMV